MVTAEANVHSLLLSKNFRPYNYDPFKRSLTELNTFGHDNTIYCRDLDFVNRRTAGANAINILGEKI